MMICDACQKRLLEAEAAGMSLKDYMKGKRRFVSLHNHSEFSLLDGAAKINDIMEKVKRMGQDAVAITDHGNLFGAVKAAKAAKEHGIKHIVGCELYLAPFGKTRFDRDFKKGESAYTHLVVLAKNKVGYQNLAILSSLGYDDGFYRNPRIDRDILKEHKEGLIVTTSCIGGSIPSNALNGDFYKAESDMNWFMHEFGDDFYVELQNHQFDLEDRAFDYMRHIAQEYKAQTIVTTDSHYLDAEDTVTHDCLLCIGTGQLVDMAERKFKFTGTGYHYMSEAEVVDLFPGEQAAIYRTGELADKIEDNVIEFGNIKLPYFITPTDAEDPEFAEWMGRRGYENWLTL